MANDVCVLFGAAVSLPLGGLKEVWFVWGGGEWEWGWRGNGEMKRGGAGSERGE